MMRIFAALTFAWMLSSAALAEQRPLSADEIRQWLTDATATSVQSNVAWVQYFAKDGATPYWAKGSTVSKGQWSVRGTAENGQYCSRWPPVTDWNCYTMKGTVLSGIRHVTWVSPSGHKSSATLTSGQHAPEW